MKKFLIALNALICGALVGYGFYLAFIFDNRMTDQNYYFLAIGILSFFISALVWTYFLGKKSPQAYLSFKVIRKIFVTLIILTALVVGFVLYGISQWMF